MNLYLLLLCLAPHIAEAAEAIAAEPHQRANLAEILPPKIDLLLETTVTCRTHPPLPPRFPPIHFSVRYYFPLIARPRILWELLPKKRWNLCPVGNESHFLPACHLEQKIKTVFEGYQYFWLKKSLEFFTLLKRKLDNIAYDLLP